VIDEDRRDRSADGATQTAQPLQQLTRRPEGGRADAPRSRHDEVRHLEVDDNASRSCHVSIVARRQGVSWGRPAYRSGCDEWSGAESPLGMTPFSAPRAHAGSLRWPVQDGPIQSSAGGSTRLRLAASHIVPRASTMTTSRPDVMSSRTGRGEARSADANIARSA